MITVEYKGRCPPRASTVFANMPSVCIVNDSDTTVYVTVEAESKQVEAESKQVEYLRKEIRRLQRVIDSARIVFKA